MRGADALRTRVGLGIAGTAEAAFGVGTAFATVRLAAVCFGRAGRAAAGLVEGGFDSVASDAAGRDRFFFSGIVFIVTVRTPGVQPAGARAGARERRVAQWQGSGLLT